MWNVIVSFTQTVCILLFCAYVSLCQSWFLKIFKFPRKVHKQSKKHVIFESATKKFAKTNTFHISSIHSLLAALKLCKIFPCTIAFQRCFYERKFGYVIGALQTSLFWGVILVFVFSKKDYQIESICFFNYNSIIPLLKPPSSFSANFVWCSYVR